MRVPHATKGVLFESRPPNVFEPVFLQFEISGKSAGAGGVEKFFGLLTGNFSLPYVSILKILRILWRNQKWVKNTQNIFDPRPNLRVRPWLMGREPELMGKSFLKNVFTLIVYGQNYQCVIGIILRNVCWGTH